ncbi:MAG: Gfo/Idh/MocA family oxidoreductase [Geminocystis sp.]|nr:Gfo/Idh/MocA family oxidoreductase [Geminocystis sp.]
MKVLKVVFVGGGINSIAGYPHYSASRLDGRFELIGGVFSRNEDINLKSAEFYSAKLVARNLDELIELSKGMVDIAIVLTPTPFHFQHVETLLNAGLPVVCEKPLFKTYEELLEFEKRVDINNKFLVITYNYIAYPMVYELRQMVVAGELGEIINVHLEMPQESFLRPPPKLDYPPWWRKEDGPIPTIILDLASHLFSLSYYITGMKIVKVKPALKKYSKYGVVDEVKGIIEYEGGLLDLCGLVKWRWETEMGSRFPYTVQKHLRCGFKKSQTS